MEHPSEDRARRDRGHQGRRRATRPDAAPDIPDDKGCVALETFAAAGRSFNAGFRYRRDDPVVRANPQLFGTVSVRLSELGGS